MDGCGAERSGARCCEGRELTSRQPLRRLIKTSCHPGLLGLPGRWAGRKIGYRLRYGPRIIIDNPAEYMQSEILRSGVYERRVAEVILAVGKPGDLMLDVGANMGQHSLIAAWHGLRVHAFEPLPRLALRLKANLALNRLEERVSVFESAVSSVEGSATLHEMDRADDGSHSLLASATERQQRDVEVRTVTIDGHLKAHSCGPPAIIKIDVEGAEALVLDGAKQTLHAPDAPVVLLETGHHSASVLGETADTVLNRLLKMGYRVFEIDDGCAYCEELPRPAVWPGSRDYVAVPAGSERIEAVLNKLHGWYSAKAV